MTDTQEIKNRLDLVDVVQDYGVQLRKSGRNYAGFCPFHANTRTPAFYVFPESQTWRCFGACAEGGDVFSFVMKKNGWDFRETLVDLARRAGVTLEETRPKDAAREAIEDRQVALLDAASNYYHQLLLHAPQAEAARRYVSDRGLNDDTVNAFRLGFALDSWDAAKTHFTGQGYSEEELLAVGLLTEHEERHTRYDRFRGRFMIPIRDLDGRVVGFGARTLDPDGIPKYLNSPQTALFDKGHLIFNLDMARRHIRDAREVVLVEGYLDVMTAWQHGFRNVVAQMGTALTETQLRLLQKHSKRFVLALDPDAAGAKATLRSLQLARETLDRELDVRFDARGLVQLEGRLRADIRVVTLPEGKTLTSLFATTRPPGRGSWPKPGRWSITSSRLWPPGLSRVMPRANRSPRPRCCRSSTISPTRWSAITTSQNWARPWASTWPPCVRQPRNRKRIAGHEPPAAVHGRHTTSSRHQSKTDRHRSATSHSCPRNRTCRPTGQASRRAARLTAAARSPRAGCVIPPSGGEFSASMSGTSRRAAGSKLLADPPQAAGGVGGRLCARRGQDYPGHHQRSHDNTFCCNDR